MTYADRHGHPAEFRRVAAVVDLNPRTTYLPERASARPVSRRWWPLLAYDLARDRAAPPRTLRAAGIVV